MWTWTLLRSASPARTSTLLTCRYPHGVQCRPDGSARADMIATRLFVHVRLARGSRSLLWLPRCFRAQVRALVSLQRMVWAVRIGRFRYGYGTLHESYVSLGDPPGAWRRG